MQFWVKLLLPILWIAQSDGMDMPDTDFDSKSMGSKGGQDSYGTYVPKGEEKLYELDFSKCELARTMIKAISDDRYANLVDEFDLIIRNRMRPDIDKEAIYLKRIIDLGYQERKFGVSLKLYECKTVGSVIDIMTTHFKDHFDTEWEEKDREFKKDVSQIWDSLTDYIAEYEEYRKTYGPIKTWQLQNYVNKLLNIDNVPLSITQQDSYEIIYRHLIQSGFVRSAIQTTRHFQYNPGVLVRSYINAHKNIDRLIFGCGHHLNGTISDYLGLEREAFCGMCDLTHFHHGDLTIALYTTDLPDVVANMHDDRIWQVLQERCWKTIGDHSWGESLTNPTTLKRIYNCLDDDGIFEIWSVSKDLIEKAYEVGFKLFQEIPEKQLVLLKKS